MYFNKFYEYQQKEFKGCWGFLLDFFPGNFVCVCACFEIMGFCPTTLYIELEFHKVC